MLIVRIYVYTMTILAANTFNYTIM